MIPNRESLIPNPPIPNPPIPNPIPNPSIPNPSIPNPSIPLESLIRAIPKRPNEARSPALPMGEATLPALTMERSDPPRRLPYNGGLGMLMLRSDGGPAEALI